MGAFLDEIETETITGQVSAAFGVSMLVPDVRVDRLEYESAPEVTVFVSAPVAVSVTEVAALLYEVSLGDPDGLGEIEPDEALRMVVEIVIGNGWCEIEAIRERVTAGLVGAPGEALAYWRACLELARDAVAPVLPAPGPTPRPRKPSCAAARDASRTAATDASLMVGAGWNSGGSDEPDYHPGEGGAARAGLDAEPRCHPATRRSCAGRGEAACDESVRHALMRFEAGTDAGRARRPGPFYRDLLCAVYEASPAQLGLPDTVASDPVRYHAGRQVWTEVADRDAVTALLYALPLDATRLAQQASTRLRLYLNLVTTHPRCPERHVLGAGLRRARAHQPSWLDPHRLTVCQQRAAELVGRPVPDPASQVAPDWLTGARLAAAASTATLFTPPPG